MKADLKQLEEMQKDLFRQQCDLDIQKAMLKHFIKKKEDEQLTLTDVVVPKGTLVCDNCETKLKARYHTSKGIFCIKCKDLTN
tara:strand:- start:95 stop:343 length:249 start_codon:yes stop_codon:yes gene_type:complete